jgi:ferric enterobactin receptor
MLAAPKWQKRQNNRLPTLCIKTSKKSEVFFLLVQHFCLTLRIKIQEVMFYFLKLACEKTIFIPTFFVAMTNVDGYFTLLKVPSDTVTILVNYMGFKLTRYFMSPKVPLNNVVIELEPDLQELGEVTITSERTEVLQASETISMLRMTPRNLTKLPNVGERDPFRAFQLMPGVSASNESSSGLYVRGGTPDQTLVLYDGFTVYHVDNLFGFFSAFNYNAIKDIQLFKGGFDARYGGRISAVAEITGKEGNKKQFNAGADASLLSLNAFVEAPIGKKISVLVAARRSYKRPLYTKIFNSFTSNQTAQNTTGGPNANGGRGQRNNFVLSLLTQTAASYFYDLNSKVTFTPTKKDTITLTQQDGTVRVQGLGSLETNTKSWFVPITATTPHGTFSAGSITSPPH